LKALTDERTASQQYAVDGSMAVATARFNLGTLELAINDFAKMAAMFGGAAGQPPMPGAGQPPAPQRGPDTPPPGGRGGKGGGKGGRGGGKGGKGGGGGGGGGF